MIPQKSFYAAFNSGVCLSSVGATSIALLTSYLPLRVLPSLRKAPQVTNCGTFIRILVY